ncbi:MAG: hypothetical protein JW941_03590 [Candidatus Coatesbacteria bacterium]|nr:hypothetical protein [Candidatus Coatesbacteria bacterium]
MKTKGEMGRLDALGARVEGALRGFRLTVESRLLCPGLALLLFVLEAEEGFFLGLSLLLVPFLGARDGIYNLLFVHSFL